MDTSGGAAAAPAWEALLDALEAPAVVVRRTRAAGAGPGPVGVEVLACNRGAAQLLGPVPPVAGAPGALGPLLAALRPAVVAGSAACAVVSLPGGSPTAPRTSVEAHLGPAGALGPELALVVLWDRTEQDRAHAELRRTEARHRAMLDALDVGVALADADGVARTANAAASRIMGVGDGDIEGTAVPDWITVRQDGTFWPPEANPTTVALRTGEPQVEQVVGAAPPGGARRWLSVTARPVYEPGGGEPVGVVTAFSDITERWEADARLQQALDRLQRSFGTSLVGMAVVDGDGRLLDVNAAFARLLDRGEADLVGRPFAEVAEAGSWRAVSPDGRTLPATSTELEFRYQLPGGAVVDTLTSITPLAGAGVGPPGAGGEGQHFVCAQDLTERKRLEHQLLESQKLEAVGQLAGGVAHDFNNLLMVIMGHVDATLADPSLPGPLAASLEQALAATERGAQLVDSLLSFSRHQVLATEPVDVNDLVAVDVALLSRLIGEDVELALELDPAVGSVTADRGRLGQVLMNVVLNARDAMPDGGRLTIRTAVGPPGEGDGPDGPVIEVHDTGVGMDPATQDRAFDPFFTTKPRGRGTGLGLSTAYGIVTQLGGTLSARSQPGRGSTFRIWLPSPGTAPPAPAPAPAPGPGAGREGPVPDLAGWAGGLVLVAEDDPEVRALVSSCLRDHGCAVVEAEDGRRALDLVRDLEERPDLAVTDMVMPGAGGTELAAGLRARWPDVPVLYMTGHADRSPLDVGEGGTGLLHKPFSRRQLLGALAPLVRPAGPR